MLPARCNFGLKFKLLSSSNLTHTVVSSNYKIDAWILIWVVSFYFFCCIIIGLVRHILVLASLLMLRRNPWFKMRMMAFFLHFLFYDFSVEFLQIQYPSSFYLIFLVHFDEFFECWLEGILMDTGKVANYQKTSDSPLICLRTHIFAWKLID